MPLLPRLVSLWRNLRQRERVERELDDELRAYAGLLEDEKQAQGQAPDAARRAALLEIGGLEPLKEGVRDVRLGALFETFVQDARFGLRSLARSPGFAATAVGALALGIGASSAIFSVVDAVLLRPLPYADADRLVAVLHRGVNPVAPANFLDWRAASSTFDGLGAAESWAPNLTGGERPEKIDALQVTADLLPLLGVAPQLGRLFTAGADQPGREHEVVLGDRLWQRRFAGAPDVVGRRITLDGESYSVVGVMPRGFEFPPFWATGAELWVPLPLADRAANRNGQSLRLLGRLRPGVSLAQARSEIATITARLEQAYPGTNREVAVRPLREMAIGDVRPALLVLLGAVCCLLLIACTNVAHLLLARAAVRHKEAALRATLGASRGRMLRQFLTESLVLAGLGGAAGLAVAGLGLRFLVALAADSVPRVETARLDLRVLAVTLAVSVLTGIGFGLAPALQASRRDLAESLREGERGTTAGLRRQRLRGLLIGSEVALALVLLVGAGLMMRSFAALRAVDPGFDPGHVLTAVVSVTGARAAEPTRRVGFYQELLERVRGLPGVVSAGAINHLPLAGDIWGWPFEVEGAPPPGPGESPSAAYRVVLPRYFQTMGQPIVRGRDFSDRDSLGAPGVVVVNECLAARHWPGQDPIGKRITFDDLDKDPTWLSVVGVARNAVRSRWAEAPEDEIYLPLLQQRSYLERTRSQYTYLTLVLRARGDATALASALRAAVWSIEPDVTVAAVQTMDDVVAQSTAGSRFLLLLLGSFAAAALALAAVGIYGVMSYSVACRTSEIGIRVALGATRGDVLRLVVGEALAVAGAGAAVGLLAALGLSRLMSSLLYAVTASDPLTFAGVCLLLAGVALAASSVPALRATRIDPLVALRSE
jgi:putative ABC transport system permease protein